MATRGRKSAAELSVVTPLDTRRPPPPEELTDAQKDVWRRVVGAMPPDWFGRESFEILHDYCRHVARAAMLGAQIEIIEANWRKGNKKVLLYDKLLAMAERESRCITALARCMRLTHQARQDPKTAARAVRNSSGGISVADYLSMDDDDD